MRHRLYLHVAWTTRLRAPILTLPAAAFLAELLPRLARQERTEVIALGIVRTHLHLVVRVHPTTSLPTLLQRLKGVSATLARKERKIHIMWGKGYNV